MAEMLFALVLAVVMVLSAELVRLSCRRQLAAPVRLRNLAAAAHAEVE